MVALYAVDPAWIQNLDPPYSHPGHAVSHNVEVRSVLQRQPLDNEVRSATDLYKARLLLINVGQGLLINKVPPAAQIGIRPGGKQTAAATIDNAFAYDAAGVGVFGRNQ
ncbi:Unknown protein sequence [Pseudomonas amygdali pv. mori]|uniref:Uncharacterized protein n=1 Tax=Pseudomonas amygdali pv. mori TaxID=34065 RepID=A0A0P9UZ40_PSEA0|nr:Unknown protein sequence [Pseudomonas amygdali pv. mori]